jgi:hypothetical protein
MADDELDITLRDFSLEALNEADEAKLIATLAQRIAYLLDHEPALLFSTLYRLDVLEVNINAVLKSNEDTAFGLARLILDRQKEKLKTRSKWRVDWSVDDD